MHRRTELRISRFARCAQTVPWLAWLVACGERVPDDASTRGEASTSSASGPELHECDPDCCRDDVQFSIEDGRTEFTLTFELSSLRNQPRVVCPGGPHDVPGSWSVECDEESVSIDAEGIYFSSEGVVRLDDGSPQAFALEFVQCNCNCLPMAGDVVVLVDPTGSTDGEGTET